MGGAAGLVLYGLASGKVGALTLLVGDRRGHLGSLGQVSGVQGRPERHVHVPLMVYAFAPLNCQHTSTRTESDMPDTAQPT